MKKIENTVLEELKDSLGQLLKDNSFRLLLFGSRARGDYDLESDFDLALIVKNLNRNLRNSILEMTAEIEFKYDFPVSLLIFDEDTFNHLKEKERRIALDIEREGIPV